MKPTFYQPHQALINYVSHFMILDIKTLGKPYSSSIPFPPTPQHSIHFYPGDAIQTSRPGGIFSPSPQSVIVGPQVSRVNLSMGSNHKLLTVAFHPGGMYRLLKIPMHELYDQPYDAVDILGPPVKEINEKLRAANNPFQMKTVVEDYLLKKLTPSPLTAFEHSAKLMLQGHSSFTMDKAADHSCLGLRQFERKSKQIMGYSPKFFHRLIRFSKAYRLKVSQPLLSWTNISYACGYYDQMHLIRDFKEFAGANPEKMTKEILLSPMQVQDHLRI